MSNKYDKSVLASAIPEIVRLIEYDSKSGEFTWKHRRSAFANAGSKAGAIHKTGYIVIQLNGRDFYAHHIAWVLHYGEVPKHELDHINRNKTDNRIENLRDVTTSENLINRAVFKNSLSGIKGVSFHRQSGKWQARTYGSSGRKYIGLFDTATMAEQACKKALEELK